MTLLKDYLGDIFEFSYLSKLDSIMANISFSISFLVCLLPCYILICIYIATYFKGDEKKYSFKDDKIILGRKLSKWSKDIQDSKDLDLFKKLCNEGDADSLKYQMLLLQTKQTLIDVLDDRYLRSDDFYINYVTKVENAHIEITEYLEEINSIKVKIRKYNQLMKKDKRSEDKGAGDDELTNQIINNMNIKKSNRTIRENYKTLWETLQVLQNLIFEIIDEPSHHEPFSQTSREEIILQVKNFRKSF